MDTGGYTFVARRCALPRVMPHGMCHLTQVGQANPPSSPAVRTQLVCNSLILQSSRIGTERAIISDVYVLNSLVEKYYDETSAFVD